MTVALDARVMCLSRESAVRIAGPDGLSLQDRLDSVAVKHIVLRHSTSLDISPISRLSLTAQTLARSGVGGGNLLLKYVCTPSPQTQFEVRVLFAAQTGADGRHNRLVSQHFVLVRSTSKPCTTWTPIRMSRFGCRRPVR